MSAPTVEAPLIVTAPGVYDIPNDLYHSDPVPGGSLSSSSARRLLPPSTPAHFQWHRNNPEPFKPAYNFGSAAHAKVLGADEHLIVIIDADNYKTKAAQNARDAAHKAGQIPLLPKELAEVEAMADELESHPIASQLFAPDSGRPEVSLFAEDEQTGVMLRARPDWLPHENYGQIILPDYKTANRADLQTLIRKVHEYRYPFQGVWYSRVIKALDLAEDVTFVLVVQESDAPYLVHVVQPDIESMDRAAEEVRLAIDTYAECAATDEWPGYADDISLLPLPRWARNGDFS
jgi:hypothetical protein